MTTQAMGKKTEPFTIDLEKLLAPISVEHPSGDSLRYVGTYDAIEDARREDDTNLPQGVWKTEIKKADWNRVMLISLEALETRSKDLQLAAWLLESWLHLYGFSGVEQGLKLLTGLCESFWDDIHPQRADDDLEARTAPVQWINDRLSEKLKRVPITKPETDEGHAYCWSDWESALHLAKLAAADPAAAQVAEKKGKVTQQKFRVSVSLTRSPYFIQLVGDLDRAVEALAAFQSCLESRCGDATPSLTQFRTTLADIRAFGANVLKERMEEEDAPTEPEPEDAELSPPEEEEEGESERGYRVGSIKSRADAYRKLSEAAEYLEMTEPHSPTPYLVKRAVSWGNMPLSELLAELLRDNADLKTVYKLLGIPREKIE